MEDVMARVDWYIEGVGSAPVTATMAVLASSSPVQPRATAAALRSCIDRGHFGTPQLAKVCAALLYAWPGLIYEGNGEIQAIIDERASAEQRIALETGVYGGETDEGQTHWWVYRAMSSTLHPPIFKPIEFEVKIEARTARVMIPGILESTGRPIRSPATGAEHRVRIDIPDGIEFEIAEIGSATTRTLASIALDLNDTYGQFNVLRHSGHGIVR
jgi:hypothetical protein